LFFDLSNEKLMNGRFFSGRKLDCFYYDGKTNYDRKVALDEEEKRIGFELFLFLFWGVIKILSH